MFTPAVNKRTTTTTFKPSNSPPLKSKDHVQRPPPIKLSKSDERFVKGLAKISLERNQKNGTKAVNSPSRPDHAPSDGEVQPDLDPDPQGDLVLIISHGQLSHQYRVSTTKLTSTSSYFSTLLSGRFGESEKVQQAHFGLLKTYTRIADAPKSELPTIKIEDLGRISAVKSIATLCADFLSILHEKSLLSNAPSVAMLANLAIVADRFDALENVKSYMKRKKILQAIDGKTTAKAENVFTEEKLRQRVLVATLLDHPPWMEKYTGRMICKGLVDHHETPGNSALWWDLPSSIEDELAFRRACVLETIQSIPIYFIGLYTGSGRQQCWLGYDNSLQCDSFQLGEMIRFFSRASMISIRGMISGDPDEEPPPGFEGDVLNLLDRLKNVSEYQIDRNHSHCGIRTRLIPIVDLLTICLAHVGICGECWSNRRFEHSWMDAKRPLLWKRADTRVPVPHSHEGWHACVRNIFTASTRDWS